VNWVTVQKVENEGQPECGLEVHRGAMKIAGLDIGRAVMSDVWTLESDAASDQGPDDGGINLPRKSFQYLLDYTAHLPKSHQSP
jgi:hypothetical protein